MTTDNTTPRINIAPNGPYLVSGALKLIQREPAMSIHGEPLEWDPVGAPETPTETRERFALCRCGESSSKPFCDGTHARAEFDGGLTADRGPSAERRQTAAGNGVVMTDDGTFCMDAGFCGTRLTNVHDMINRTSDPEVRDRLKRMVGNCPSGRLQFSLTEGGEPVEPEYEPSIATIPDGPLWVRGGIAVQAADGFTYEVRNRVTLCRCGQSNNKPFCDGTHKNIGFTAP